MKRALFPSNRRICHEDMNKASSFVGLWFTYLTGKSTASVFILIRGCQRRLSDMVLRNWKSCILCWNRGLCLRFVACKREKKCALLVTIFWLSLFSGWSCSDVCVGCLWSLWWRQRKIGSSLRVPLWAANKDTFGKKFLKGCLHTLSACADKLKDAIQSTLGSALITVSFR